MTQTKKFEVNDRVEIDYAGRCEIGRIDAIEDDGRTIVVEIDAEPGAAYDVPVSAVTKIESGIGPAVRRL